MKKILNNKGYTLIEIIVSISIFSIVLIMITSFFVNFTNFHSKIEKDSLLNTNIINTINAIKYRIDQTDYIEIVSKEYILENKNKGYNLNYIMLDNKNIVLGNLSKDDNIEILNNNEIGDKINLLFKKDEKNNSTLIIELTIVDENNNYKIKPLMSSVNIQNIKFNNSKINGIEGNAIVYKIEQN